MTLLEILSKYSPEPVDALVQPLYRPTQSLRDLAEEGDDAQDDRGGGAEHREQVQQDLVRMPLIAE